MLNPFFLNGSQGEQGLLQSLINEQLKMYGVDVHYLPRKYVTSNTVIREVIESKFDSAYPIEAYIDSYEGYGGQGTILSKFGIEEKDDLTLIISKERFESYITPLTENLPDIKLATRPKEGDLIYFPLGDRLFEIKYVEHEQPFYQLKENYVYQLRCELFRYEDEVIDTNIDEIDDEIEQIGYIQTLTMIGAGVTATGIATYCPSGAVQKIYITNIGQNYTSTPIIGFSSAPDGGETAVAKAILTQEYAGCDDSNSGKLDSICLTNAGCGYTVAPWISISGGGGTGAAATAGIVTTGAVQTVSIVNAGSGYTSNPTITFIPQNNYQPIGFVTATAEGLINTSGVVTSICITNAGAGYTADPTVSFETPGISTDIGTGTYVFNEIVTGEISGTTARVKQWDKPNFALEVSVINGTFTTGEVLVGSESGARYSVMIQNDDDLVSGYADNDNIQSQADFILDFTESNPFGMP